MPYRLATPHYPKRVLRKESRKPPTLFPHFLGWVKGLEPSTPGTTIRCSNQLSYTHQIAWKQWKNGTPEGTRTPDPLLRRQLLYPAELQAHIVGTIPFRAVRLLGRRLHLQNRHRTLPALQMERVMGIEPTRPAWKAGILPLNYTRIGSSFRNRQLI